MSGAHFSPDAPEFGFVCGGYVYSLKIVLTNYGREMKRFRPSCNNCSDQSNPVTCSNLPITLAPGVSAPVYVQLRANNPCQLTFEFSVICESTKSSSYRIISALIIPVSTFKSISSYLLLKGRDIYSSGVKCIGHTGNFDGSEGSPTTFFTENALSDDDIQACIQ
jgi:hypothetical protein